MTRLINLKSGEPTIWGRYIIYENYYIQIYQY
jgi:hypothetical protein